MRNLKVVRLATAGRITASGNGSAVDVKPYSGEARLVLNSGAGSASGVKLDVKIQHSDDGSTWADTGIAFAQVTDAAPSFQVVGVNVDRFRRYIRAVDTVAGSGNVERSVELVAKQDYS